jgi:hypothetical protein
MYLLRAVDGVWATTCLASGLSSGEGLIFHVRDPREEKQPIKDKGRVVGYETVLVDQGVEDKRLLVEEPELAAVLKRMNHESNSLSAVMRQAWDSGTLRTLTRNSPLRATGAHISILAHITVAELQLHLAENDRINGWANRYMLFLVRRSKLLPNPRPVPNAVLLPLINELDGVAMAALGVGVLERDEEAEAAWTKIYPTLSAEKPGLVGALTARAEAQVLRLGVLYAALDRSPVVRLPHLKAALAVWQYAETSAHEIFGDRLGDPIADAIEAALKAKGPMPRTNIRDLFHRNVSSERITVALTFLASQGRARRRPPEPGGNGGRPAETWEAAS